MATVVSIHVSAPPPNIPTGILTPKFSPDSTNFYITEDGMAIYVFEDGKTFYVQET